MSTLAVDSIEGRLTELGLSLPTTSPQSGKYVSATQFERLVFVSGHASREGGEWIVGRLGATMGVDEGRAAARSAALACLATLKQHLGSLDRIERVLKVMGYVNAAPDFEDHPRVMDGCSELLIELFAPNGRHARTSVGLSSLPHGVAVEVDLIVALRPEAASQA